MKHTLERRLLPTIALFPPSSRMHSPVFFFVLFELLSFVNLIYLFLYFSFIYFYFFLFCVCYLALLPHLQQRFCQPSALLSTKIITIIFGSTFVLPVKDTRGTRESRAIASPTAAPPVKAAQSAGLILLRSSTSVMIFWVAIVESGVDGAPFLCKREKFNHMWHNKKEEKKTKEK